MKKRYIIYFNSLYIASEAQFKKIQKKEEEFNLNAKFDGAYQADEIGFDEWFNQLKPKLKYISEIDFDFRF